MTWANLQPKEHATWWHWAANMLFWGRGSHMGSTAVPQFNALLPFCPSCLDWFGCNLHCTFWPPNLPITVCEETKTAVKHNLTNGHATIFANWHLIPSSDFSGCAQMWHMDWQGLDGGCYLSHNAQEKTQIIWCMKLHANYSCMVV